MARTAGLLKTISDPRARAALGTRIEEAAGIAFNLARWGIVLGFVRFLATETGGVGFRALYWTLAAALMGYLVSLFLLRPEIPVFRTLDTDRKRLVQTLVNMAVCMLAFMAVLWAIGRLADAAAEHRFFYTRGEAAGQS